MATKKKKITTAVIASVLALALLLGGTFAWQSINQTALNEASDVINPGGRLHDDFDGKNKDVYVENFAEDPIFARVRLDEYFEIIMNKGSAAQKVEVITAGAEKDKLDTYITHIFGGNNATNDFWTWQTGGETVYMPTFNKDKDSLKADINGTYAGPDNNPDTEDDAYDNYVPTPSVDDIKEDYAKYDADTDSLDNDGTTDVWETHTAKATLGATLISIDEWFNNYGAQPGPYWVYDTDGWVYWAQAIQPDTATGLLLDEIKLSQVMDDSWYYAINVVAQFVTADDLGRGTGTGFYDTNAGTAPSEKALELLEKIGVDTTAEVSTENDLRDALAAGSDVLIKGTIDSTSTENRELNINYDYLWHNGGKVSGGTLNSATGSYATLFINNENNWPEDGDGANNAVLSGTKINTQSTFGIYIQNVNADTEVNNVTINGTKGGLRAEWGGTTTLNNVNIKVDGTSGTWFENSAVATSNGADIVINSGSYTGPYAVYVYSTGDNITINGGYFDGDLRVDAGSLVIKGGTFTVDPSEFVADGYKAIYDEETKTWTVKAISEDDTAEMTETEFEALLAGGGNIDLTGKSVTTTTVDTHDLNASFDLLWSEGGTLTGGTINSNTESYATLFVNNELNWPMDGDGANEATINGTTINSASNYAVYIQTLDNIASLKDVTIVGQNGGLLVEHNDSMGGMYASLHNVNITAGSNHATDWVNTAVAAANDTRIDIHGGNYTGKYAVYIYSTGGQINIYGGTFTGELGMEHVGSLNIFEGKFSDDPTDYLATYSTVEMVDGWYVVTNNAPLL